MRPLAVMLAEVQGLVQNTGTSYGTKIKNAINRAYRAIAAANDWPSLRAEEAFTAAGTSFLILPMYVDKVVSIIDTTNGINLEPEPEIAKKYTATYSTSGTGYRWANAGYSPVFAQPSVAATISVKGDAGTDTGTTVRIMGKRHPATTSGVGYIIRAESVVTAGASSATTTNAFNEIIAITKDADSSEDIIIHVGATYLGYLAKERYVSKYPKIRLHYIPASGTSFTIQFQRAPERLVEDPDAPTFPCSDVIVQMASAELLREQKQFAKAQLMDVAAEREMQRLLTAELGLDRGAEQAIPAMGARRTYV